MARKAFKSGNKFSRSLKLTKGKSCNRKAVLRAVARGASPESAVAQHCSGSKSRRSRR